MSECAGMIPWLWLVLAVFLSTVLGFFGAALMAAVALRAAAGVD